MRVAVARALIRSPRLLLLDEPFGALDEIGRAQLDDLLYKLWQDAKMTVVLVTHSLAQAVYLAQEVCIMSQSPGTIVHRAHPCFEARGRDIRGTTAFATQVAQLHEQLRLSMQAGAGVRV